MTAPSWVHDQAIYDRQDADWLRSELRLRDMQAASIERDLRESSRSRSMWQGRAEGLAMVVQRLKKRPRVGKHPAETAAMRWMEDGPHDFWHKRPSWLPKDPETGEAVAQ